MRVVMLEMLANKGDQKGLMHKLRDIFSRYLILQPNIFGIGINFNEIIKVKDPRKE
ncbi:hypothetical protein KJ627_03630 [Patescibacteria group bacterium]|nr:hypothetical protein [Candidatus Omnitrophota bacterium]MBU2233920.1 hypothetical protein [Patescibacteria group bacterium]